MTSVAVNDAKSSSTFSELSASALYDVNQGQHHRENAQKDFVLVACVINSCWVEMYQVLPVRF
jgi:hypothetical protein